MEKWICTSPEPNSVSLLRLTSTTEEQLNCKDIILSNFRPSQLVCSQEQILFATEIKCIASTILYLQACMGKKRKKSLEARL